MTKYMIIDRFHGAYGFLSNFSRLGPYPTAEHHFQASKATTVKDAIYVMAAETPREAKRRGRSITKREDWDEVKIDVMHDVLLLKFSDPELQAQLLKTGNAILIEGNTWGDTDWGMCDGVGENWLGQLLMIVRDHYRDD